MSGLIKLVSRALKLCKLDLDQSTWLLLCWGRCLPVTFLWIFWSRCPQWHFFLIVLWATALILYLINGRGKISNLNSSPSFSVPACVSSWSLDEFFSHNLPKTCCHCTMINYMYSHKLIVWQGVVRISPVLAWLLPCQIVLKIFWAELIFRKISSKCQSST